MDRIPSEASLYFRYEDDLLRIKVLYSEYGMLFKAKSDGNVFINKQGSCHVMFLGKTQDQAKVRWIFYMRFLTHATFATVPDVNYTALGVNIPQYEALTFAPNANHIWRSEQTQETFYQEEIVEGYFNTRDPYTPGSDTDPFLSEFLVHGSTL